MTPSVEETLRYAERMVGLRDRGVVTDTEAVGGLLGAAVEAIKAGQMTTATARDFTSRIPDPLKGQMLERLQRRSSDGRREWWLKRDVLPLYREPPTDLMWWKRPDFDEAEEAAIRLLVGVLSEGRVDDGGSHPPTTQSQDSAEE